MFSNQDQKYLSRALALSRKGKAAVRPNPKVGALIVKTGRVVSDGYHAVYGGAHAEAVALNNAGAEAGGSTLYCNLEPCSFTAEDKHNGPCTTKIIEAGIKRVVIGQPDPNPRVRGQGIRQLREAGIEVELAPAVPDLEKIWYENARFNTVHSLNRVFVSLKLAQSLDGRIATDTGDSKWITDRTAREGAHKLRAEHDAVLVGIKTALSDNPRLTVRLPQDAAGTQTSSPQAVVLDAYAQIPEGFYLVQKRPEHLLVYIADPAPAGPPPAGPPPATGRRRGPMKDREKRIASLRAAGVRVRPVGSDQEGRLSLPEILADLKEEGFQSVMVEGGAQIVTAFLQHRLFDALHLFIAPALIGGDGKAIGPLGVEKISEALRLEGTSCRQAGSGFEISGFREGWLEEITQAIEEELYVHRAY
ncbi:MAG: bifunctional diaminohydroxyphosphoribosylaminopyrimidine deaminase/5-amino-6-(5-phosphoribosylamino)uracil reductase RibD [Spirochaetales bacterium]|nr:bifunctional diaminohydroxyphosphoribosylaminopyrimidine deaminase/5-amino-6-(5-phosphoribosylamino)uracil reductase RibD [Spirochaetales bacterium]MCF7938931.1 bifunctional diaminohydroxyphosphoribosylaminopyrimidine deaminase/5-amino-6-(5-phosphoribosylamino)uracil reductase RibD [Spirochaetales bacterium]